MSRKWQKPRSCPLVVARALPHFGHRGSITFQLWGPCPIPDARPLPHSGRRGRAPFRRAPPHFGHWGPCPSPVAGALPHVDTVR